MPLVIKGVHPIEAPQPCHLIDAELVDADEFDWGAVTQECAGQPRENRQAVWDERTIDDAGRRWVFFFHYLDVNRPLIVGSTRVELPKPSPMPEHLKHIKYESP